MFVENNAEQDGDQPHESRQVLRGLFAGAPSLCLGRNVRQALGGAGGGERFLVEQKEGVRRTWRRLAEAGGGQTRPGLPMRHIRGPSLAGPKLGEGTKTREADGGLGGAGQELLICFGSWVAKKAQQGGAVSSQEKQGCCCHRNKT